MQCGQSHSVCGSCNSVNIGPFSFFPIFGEKRNENECRPIISRVALQSIERKRVLVETCRQSHLLVGLSVCLSGRCTVAKRLIVSRCRFGMVSGVGGSVEGWVY